MIILPSSSNREGEIIRRIYKQCRNGNERHSLSDEIICWSVWSENTFCRRWQERERLHMFKHRFLFSPYSFAVREGHRATGLTGWKRPRLVCIRQVYYEKRFWILNYVQTTAQWNNFGNLRKTFKYDCTWHNRQHAEIPTCIYRNNN